MFGNAYVANIGLFAGNFEPVGWKFCNGQLLSISQYSALYSLIGVTYGGDGQTNFALPDLRSRVAVHAGQSPGLSNYLLGQTGGSEQVTVLSSNLPPHDHSVITVKGTPFANSANGDLRDAPGNVPASTKGINSYNSAGTGSMAKTIVSTSTPAVGGSVPSYNISPVLALNYVICVNGIYPTRN